MQTERFTAKYELRADPSNKIVFVGDHQIKEPEFYRRAENDVNFKNGFLPDEEKYWGGDLKEANAHFKDMLGPKFALRFKAANYHTWIAPHIPRDIANMLTMAGRHWRTYDGRLIVRAHNVLPYVMEAWDDGLHQIIPAIVTWQKPPQEIRQEVGKATWRAIHSMSKTRAKKIMQLSCMTYRCDEEKERFISFMNIRSGVLPFITQAGKPEIMASKMAAKMNFETVNHVVAMVRDTEHMGVDVNPEWSMRRLMREHDNAMRNRAAKEYPRERFADDWSFSQDGYTATYLASQSDIALEGMTQKHCVAGYAGMSARKEYAVFRIEGRERATLGLRALGMQWRFDQAYGAYNQPVEADTRAFCMSVMEQFIRDRAQSQTFKVPF